MPIKKFLYLSVRLVFFVYLAVLLALVVFQTKLIFPAPRTMAANWDPAEYSATEVVIDTDDQVQVHALLFDNPAANATIIYSHGNAESLCLLGDYLSEMRDEWKVRVVAFDYRGYGKTSGSPSETGLEFDAKAVARWVKSNEPWNQGPVIAMGRSMGGFTASVMASEYQLDGLLLDRAFSSIEDVASARYPIFPVRWLLRHKMRSADWINDYYGPLLQIHGHNDFVIPFFAAKNLFEACPSSNKHLIELRRLSHNQELPKEFVLAAKDLIDELKKKHEQTVH